MRNCDYLATVCPYGNNLIQTAETEHTNFHVHANYIHAHYSSSLSANVHADNICDLNSSFSSVMNDHVSDVNKHDDLLRSVYEYDVCSFTDSNTTFPSNMQNYTFNTESSFDLNDACSTVNLGLTGKGMRIGHLNIQGLSSKIDQDKLMWKPENNSIHILGLSESKLKECHLESVFCIEGFQNPIRKDRLEDGGGRIIVYVKEGMIFKRKNDLEPNNLECVWIEICPTNSRSFLVCFMYRHPSSTITWNKCFENCLDIVLEEEKEFYILCVFNRDLLNSTIKKLAWFYCPVSAESVGQSSHKSNSKIGYINRSYVLQYSRKLF